MPEPIEAEALPIEQDITPTSGLDRLVASITAEAERLATEYMPREITSEDDYKQSKRERSGARKDIAELKGRYDTQMRAIKDAVKEADARIKAALDPLARIDGGYKAKVDEYEARWKSKRLADLAEAYADFAPDLVPLVPFERLMARFGTEKGKQWDARSVSDKQAEEAMRKAVEVVAHDEAFISDSPYEAQDKAAIEEEIGDLLLTVTSLCRKLSVEPEVALNRATDKFIDRFEILEKEILADGKDINSMNMTELDEVWDKIKKKY